MAKIFGRTLRCAVATIVIALTSQASAERGGMERNCPPEGCKRMFEKAATCAEARRACLLMSAGGPPSNASACDARWRICLEGPNRGCWLGRGAKILKCGLRPV